MSEEYSYGQTKQSYGLFSNVMCISGFNISNPHETMPHVSDKL